MGQSSLLRCAVKSRLTFKSKVCFKRKGGNEWCVYQYNNTCTEVDPLGSEYEVHCMGTTYNGANYYHFIIRKVKVRDLTDWFCEVVRFGERSKHLKLIAGE